MKNFAKELDGIEHLQKWDSGYYSEKLKQKLFSLDDEQLKPYFKLENVIDGAFIVANKLFGLQFEEIDIIDKYHEDVLTYEVTNEKANLFLYFMQIFSQEKGKEMVHG